MSKISRQSRALLSLKRFFRAAHHIILTARAAGRAVINHEVIPRIIIKFFARRDNIIAPGGEKAGLVLGLF